jgi:hypothetical protein
MDKPISVGDLVQVVKPAICGCGNSLGLIFEVGALDVRRDDRCRYCHKKRDGTKLAWSDKHCGYVELYRLIRIDPPAESESTRTEETLKEPA